MRFLIYYRAYDCLFFLEKELNVKLRENKRLRGENLALQNKTPPHFDYGDSVQMQRRLKSEIGHLEGYIKKLEKEQCDLEEQLQQKSDIVSVFALFALKLLYCLFRAVLKVG